LPTNIGQHRLKRFQIPVNIADYGPFQFTARFGASSIKNLPAAQSDATIYAPILVIHQSKRLFSQGQAGPGSVANWPPRARSSTCRPRQMPPATCREQSLRRRWVHGW
jgi:hypothetical protein